MWENNVYCGKMMCTGYARVWEMEELVFISILGTPGSYLYNFELPMEESKINSWTCVVRIL